MQNVVAALARPDVLLPLSVVVFFLLPLIVALWAGRVFCAGVCPLGAVQDLVLLRPIPVPRTASDVLRLLPLLYLAGTVLLAAVGSMSLICRFDPFVTLFRRSGGAGMVAYSVVFLLLCVVVARPYCRFLCPYGVLLGWLAQLAPQRAQIAEQSCVACRLCEQHCPVDAIRWHDAADAAREPAGGCAASAPDDPALAGTDARQRRRHRLPRSSPGADPRRCAARRPARGRAGG